MIEEERQAKIKQCEATLLCLAAERTKHQIALCQTIAAIQQLREVMRNLGYQAPSATGA